MRPWVCAKSDLVPPGILLYHFFGLHICLHGTIDIIYCIAHTIPIKRVLEARVHVKQGVWVPKTKKSEDVF